MLSKKVNFEFQTADDTTHAKSHSRQRVKTVSLFPFKGHYLPRIEPAIPNTRLQGSSTKSTSLGKALWVSVGITPNHQIDR